MSTASIKQLIVSITGSLLIAMPLQALAAVNQNPQSAATAGLQYLTTQQQNDGSISGLIGGESEWSVEAVEANGQKASAFAHGGTSLLDFVKTDTPSGSTAAATLERNIIAIEAAGADSANFGGINYDTLLAKQHQEGQIGGTTFLNDDIFGVIAIDAAHDPQLKSMAQDGLDYFLAHQTAAGGFSSTTDTCDWCGIDNNDTAAAIIALYAAEDLGLTPTQPGVTLAKAKANALAYLLSTQSTDGGFNLDGASPSDGGSTAWSLMALNTLGDSVSAQALQARDWLLKDQNPDGGFSYGAYGITASDTYTTAHAVTALLGTTWLLRPAPLGSVIASPTTVSSTPASSPSQLTGAGTGGSQPTPQNLNKTKPATITVSSDPTPPALTLVASDTTLDNPAPQVKGASTTTQPNSSTHNPITIKTDKSHTSYAVYAVGLLGLVAVVWFVLESRKSKGIS